MVRVICGWYHHLYCVNTEMVRFIQYSQNKHISRIQQLKIYIWKNNLQQEKCKKAFFSINSGIPFCLQCASGVGVTAGHTVFCLGFLQVKSSTDRIIISKMSRKEGPIRYNRVNLWRRCAINEWKIVSGSCEASSVTMRSIRAAILSKPSLTRR